MNTLQKRLFVMGFLLNAGTSLVWADNAVYIDQIGSGVDIDITQDGSGNTIGGSSQDDTKMKISGDNITLSIDTVGSSNSVIGDIIGSDTVIDLDIGGSSNTLNFNIDPSNTFGAAGGDYQIGITGGDNTIDLDIGTADSAGNVDLDWVLDGDFNTMDVDIDSENATNYIDWVGDNSTFNYDADGYTGHSLTFNGSGSYLDIDIEQQSTLQSDNLEIDLNGSGTSTTPSTLCISQSDSGTSTGCQ